MSPQGEALAQLDAPLGESWHSFLSPMMFWHSSLHPREALAQLPLPHGALAHLRLPHGALAQLPLPLGALAQLYPQWGSTSIAPSAPGRSLPHFYMSVGKPCNTRQHLAKPLQLLAV